jgi:hypothetical protein
MYADLPLGLNFVEDPSFENGISKWRSSGQWLAGTLNGPFWYMKAKEFFDVDYTYPQSGKRMLGVDNVAPQTAGIGGIGYDFDIPLPAGTYRITAYIRPFLHGGNQLIVLRAGRSDIAVPGIIGQLLTDTPTGHHEFDLLWNRVEGTFTSDGIHPTSILVRNEYFGAYGAWLIDSVSVIAETSPFQLDLYNQMTPVADQDAVAGYPLKRYLRAYAMMFDQVESYIRDAPDGTPGWATLANPRTAPAETLDWLSQIGGTKLPFGSTTPDKRQLIDDAPSRERGTRNAIIKSVQTLLTGTKYVAFHERIVDNDHFAVGVLKSESPTSDWFQNIVTNASFESAVVPWLNSGGVLTGSSTISRDGQSPKHQLWALKVTTTATQQGTRYDLGVLPAGVYGWTVAMRGAVGAEEIVITPGAFAFEQAAVLTTSWQSFSGTFTADGVSSYQFALRTQAPTPAASTFYVDAVGVGLSGVAPPEFVDFSVAATTKIKAAVEAERPVGFIQNNPVFTNNPWSYWAINSTIIATKVGNDVLYLPVYPTYQDIKRHFTSYTDLKNNSAHAWENLLGDFYDPSLEKTISGWFTTGSNLTSGATVALTTGVPLKDASAGQIVTNGLATNEGVRLDMSTWTGGKPGTYTVSVSLRAIGTATTVEVYAGSGATPTLIFTGTVGTGAWTQAQGQFTTDGSLVDNLVIRIPASAARTINFDLYALAPGVVTIPATF